MATPQVLPDHIPEEFRPLFEDFRKFLWVIWHHLNLPDPTPVQYDMGLYLQHGPRRSIIEAFRGVGKSWITAAFVLWCLWRNPQMKIMVVSQSKERADSFSIFCKRLIFDVPLLAFLQPQGDQRASNIAFDVGPAHPDQSPSVKSVGITGQLTGSRADMIVADDIETPNNSMTQTQRDQVAERVKEFDAVLKPNGRIMYLGTPQTEMTLYNKMPERGYEIRVWPARMPKAGNDYGGRLAPFIQNMGLKEGEPTDPARFTDLDLMEREASYGRSGFALQFQLDTTLSDANKYPLKLSDLIVMSGVATWQQAPASIQWSSGPEYAQQDLPVVGLDGDKLYRPMMVSKELSDFQGCVMAIDPSGRGADETGYAVVKMCMGMLYLVDMGGYRDGYGNATLEGLAEVAKKHGVNEIVIESNFGDGMFASVFSPVLNRIYPCHIEEVRHNTQKEKRIIDTLEPVMNQHRLVVDAELFNKDFNERDEDVSPEQQKHYMLFHQMTRVTKDRGSLAHDDRLDPLAMAVKYWVDAMAADVEESLTKQREEAMQREIELFLEDEPGVLFGVGHNGGPSMSWNSR